MPETHAPPDPEIDGTREERGEHLWREARVPVAGLRCEHAGATLCGRGAVLSSTRSTCTRWRWHLHARSHESLATSVSFVASSYASFATDCSGD